MTETMENWKVESTNRRKNFSWGENPEKHFPGRFAFPITVTYSNDLTRSHSVIEWDPCRWNAQRAKNLQNQQQKINHFRYMDDCGPMLVIEFDEMT